MTGKPAEGRVRRRWFRAVALLFPLVLLASVELGLRLAGWGYPGSFFLEARKDGHRMLTENPQFTWRFFPPTIARTPQPSELALKKPPGTVRILVFGESAAMGDPEPSYGFARQLERMLEAEFPDRKFEIVNVAVTAIDSQVMLAIARDCQKLEGDFWVIYSGNNEIIGPFGVGARLTRRTVGEGMLRAILALKSTRLGQLIQQASRWGKEPPEWVGMEMFLGLRVPRGDPRLQSVYENFSANLADAVRLGRRSGAKVLLATMPVNLKDCPPFASLHRAGLSSVEQVAWDAYYKKGVVAETAGRFDEALASYQQASQIDSDYAELRFRTARCQLNLRRNTLALKDFQVTRDLDALRFRADSTLNEITRRTAIAEHAVFVDADAECIRASPKGVPGEELFYDHVHLNFAGNFLVARLLAGEVRTALASSSASRTNQTSEIEMARRLAFTDFDQRRVAAEMRARLRQPPFNTQSDAAQRDARLREIIKSLPASPAQSVPVYQEALSEAPEDRVLHENYGRLLEAVGDIPGAVAQWEKVTQLLPRYAYAWLNLGSLACKQRRYADAQRCYVEASRCKADPIQVLNEFGLLASAQGRHEEALRSFQHALKLRAGSGVVRFNLAAELAAGGQTTEAITQYREAVRRDPNNVSAAGNLGVLLAAQNQPEEAKSVFEAALRAEPDDPQTHYNLAKLLAQQGRHADALAHYQAALAERPDYAKAQLGLGVEVAQLGKESEALRSLAEAVRLAPDSSDAHFNYGISLARAGQYASAADQFQITLRLEPAHHFAARALEQVRRRAGADSSGDSVSQPGR